MNSGESTKDKIEEVGFIIDAIGDVKGTDPDTGWSLPSALQTTSFWAGIDGCDLTPDTSAPELDLDQGLPGNDTRVARFPGCKTGTGVELWTIRGGSHVPNFLRPDWANSLWGFLSAHPMRVLGPLTFGVYLWHYPVIRRTAEHVDLPLLGLWSWALLAAVSMAALTYRFVELPVDRFRHRHLGRTSSAPAPEPADRSPR